MELSIPDKHTNFFKDVYDVVRLIPKGKVTSYGAIAKYLGAPRSSRMVGWAMNAAHGIPDVPAHRVVNRNGLLTGKMHFSTSTEMEERLLGEGIKIEKDKVLNFNEHFWNPSSELTL